MKPAITVRAAAYFNIVVGALYLIAGVAFGPHEPGIALFWAGCGLLLTVGSIGLLGGQEWGRRWAVVGLGLVGGINAFLSLVLIASVVFNSTGDNAIMAPIALLYTLFSALQLYTLHLLRSTAMHDHIWASTESRIKASPHEMVLDSDAIDAARVEVEQSTPEVAEEAR